MTRRCPPRWPQHRKLPLLQLRQKPQQTIHDQEPTLGRRKKLQGGKSKPTPPPVGPAFGYQPQSPSPSRFTAAQDEFLTSLPSGPNDKMISRIASTGRSHRHASACLAATRRLSGCHGLGIKSTPGGSWASRGCPDVRI